MKFKSLILLIFSFPLIVSAQRITYSEPESQDTKALDFEIVGKVGGNFIVYKDVRNRYAVSIYDNDMKLKDRVNLDFMPEKAINVDFVAYPDFFYIIYQYQKKSILHCMAEKIDGNGKKIGEPIQLDTTYISIFSDNKIYNTINSDDKQKVMIYKIQKKYDKFYFTTLLFNDQLQLQRKSRIMMPYDEHRDVFSDFFVDNDGNFVFIKGNKAGARDLINKISVITKAPLSDDFEEHEININDHYLDEVKLKVDNINKHYLVNALYYKQKRGNIDGLLTAVWDRDMKRTDAVTFIEFNDTLRQQAKSDGSIKLAFNDYFIRNVILRRDGGFILTSEDFYSQSRTNAWNRMDYLYGYPYLSTYDYYSPSGYWYGYRQRPFYNNGQTRYYYNNIMVLDLDKTGNLVWSNVIHKDQYDDDVDHFLSYQVMNAGGELHFLFNELERRNQLIADNSITADGKLTRNPTLKSLDRGYEFMPRYAKQVSAKQIIVPCTYRNYICFAKIDY